MIVKTILERDVKKYDLQLKQLRDTDKMDKFKIWGELLQTYGYNCPEGSESLTCDNYYTNEPVTIPLDPTISALSNSVTYFDRYNKKKRTDDKTDDTSDGEAEETYTKEELELAIKKKNDEINSIQNSIDNQNLAIRKQERKINQGSVVAEADGVVVKVDMSDENISSGFPVIVVSSEGTYSTTVSVGELDIDNISIGDEATVYCYDTGEMYMGKVVNIGTSPNGTTSYPCVQSTYPVKVSLSDVEDMVDEAYVEVTINGSAEDFEGGGDDIMLPLFLTKKDNGGYFVMKEVDGRLKKQYLETGKIYYGSQIVVKSGVTSEDYIAFPYEKEAVEGKVTVHKENDDLY